MLLLFAFLFSCRPDILLEQDARNQAAQSGLTSKIISLQESAHRSRILPELQFAKQQLTNKTGNIFGKVVSFGDSISIDTDNVIYIENGPNFHTYTFNINRTNPQPNDPVENLLLSLLPDGTYKEFLFSYNLTAQEKQKLESGENVDLKNKTNITELTKGTFNGNNQLGKSTVNCGFTTSIYYVPCCHGVHNESNYTNDIPGNFSNWNTCSCAQSGQEGPGVYLISTYGCTEVAEVIAPSEGGGGNSGGPGGGGGDPGPAPEPCVAAASNPGEVGLVDGNGCAIGVPTQPNVGNDADDRTSCQILKDNTDNVIMQSKLDSLQNIVSINNPNRDSIETSITVRKGKSITYKMNQTPKDIGVGNTISVLLYNDNLDIAQMHNHPEGYLPIFSFGDIVTYYAGYKSLIPVRKPVYISYVTSANGTTYAIKINDTSFLDTLFAGLDLDTAEGTLNADLLVRKIYKDYGGDEDASTQTKAEKLFLDVLNDENMGFGNGISIYRKDGNIWGELKKDSNGIINKTNCTL
ncbi:hypothetical protein [Frigoriflavimonas asaccharolytica]|uniref:Uncharacterized protein n=1 Tax=Frigoriflavimonas asaccharolytica TaxID=2735899 RepID=A0A8J8K635_9FLAO|nr:hypothetical protein [Frigoriflavimonas asaccharolytica]NRS93300.1 hypothetical protein [Frigoriflavimonas asaccharolytica]